VAADPCSGCIRIVGHPDFHRRYRPLLKLTHSLAMEAGTSSHVWGIEEIVRLLEAVEKRAA
jgi:hypothetical protein